MHQITLEYTICRRNNSKKTFWEGPRLNPSPKTESSFILKTLK